MISKSLLIDAHSLQDLLNGSTNCHLFDCRFQLADTTYGEQAHKRGHIEGARYVHLDRDLSSPILDGAKGRHPLPNATVLLKQCRDWGMTRSDQIVCYDDVSGPFAARLWWLLRWLGFSNVMVLDGGIRRWIEQGFPVVQHHSDQSAEAKVEPSSDLSMSPNSDMLATIGDVESISQVKGGLCLVDSRSKERYLGQEEPIDPIGGHIPGARNIPWMDNLTSEGTFKSSNELRQRFQHTIGSELPIYYCGSGVTACHNILATQIAGMNMPKLFAASWSGWIHDPTRSIAIGAESTS